MTQDDAWRTIAYGDSITSVKQILARVDDDLHARIRRHAASMGRSMNDVMISALERELAVMQDPRQRLRVRAAALGMLAESSLPRRPTSLSSEENRQAAIDALRGAGDAVLEGLEWARGPKP